MAWDHQSFNLSNQIVLVPNKETNYYYLVPNKETPPAHEQDAKPWVAPNGQTSALHYGSNHQESAHAKSESVLAIKVEKNYINAVAFPVLIMKICIFSRTQAFSWEIWDREVRKYLNYDNCKT